MVKRPGGALNPNDHRLARNARRMCAAFWTAPQARIYNDFLAVPALRREVLRREASERHRGPGCKPAARRGGVSVQAIGMPAETGRFHEA